MATKLIVSISDELNTNFRAAVFKKKGMKHGNIVEAVEEALTDWINKEA